jgi:hypothetical protein
MRTDEAKDASAGAKDSAMKIFPATESSTPRQAS